MASSLAILSGKGGSGKTTLALSLAQLLTLCNKRVLLIDCDMSTHGATYFFEDYFADKENYYTFRDFINGHEITDSTIGEIFKISGNDLITKEFINNKYFLRVQISGNAYFDFMASSLSFPSDIEADVNDGATEGIDLKSFTVLSKKYDVIIFDCQAGYSEVTSNILECSNKNLMVLEPDAVSVIAIRVLYSQLTKKLDDKKTFQVFSKVIEEEQELYKNIPPHATIFTNLDPISFNWSVRKAFASSAIPEIDEKNPELTDEIYGLAISLFPEFKLDLQKYILNIKKVLINQAEVRLSFAKKQETRENWDKLKITIAVILLLLIVGCILLVFGDIFPISIAKFNNIVDGSIVLFLFASIIMIIFFYISSNKQRREKSYSINTYKIELDLNKLKNDASNLEKILSQ